MKNKNNKIKNELTLRLCDTLCEITYKVHTYTHMNSHIYTNAYAHMNTHPNMKINEHTQMLMLTHKHIQWNLPNLAIMWAAKNTTKNPLPTMLNDPYHLLDCILELCKRSVWGKRGVT